jgi:hypothetical protein
MSEGDALPSRIYMLADTKFLHQLKFNAFRISLSILSKTVPLQA